MQSYQGQRVLDLLCVIFTAPFWLPVLVLVAIAVRLFIGAPVYFVQDRIGWNGQTFRLRKFRTMHDAFDSQGYPLPDSERLSWFGRKLRATSLDELPELFNVFAGDMAIVGPRPLLTKYLERYSPRHRRRHNVRPGLTGLAQVSGRNAIDWSQRFELDLIYIENASVWLDLRILLLTVRAVLKRDGISAPGDPTSPEFIGYDRLPK